MCSSVVEWPLSMHEGPEFKPKTERESWWCTEDGGTTCGLPVSSAISETRERPVQEEARPRKPHLARGGAAAPPTHARWAPPPQSRQLPRPRLELAPSAERQP